LAHVPLCNKQYPYFPLVLGGMFAVAEASAAAEGGVNFKLKEGFSAETSGFVYF